jgi:hypothetical protein
MEKNRIEMSRRDRDVLKVMSLVVKGERTQAEAGRLLDRSERQIRRLQRRMEAEGDGGVVHRLRGRPSNHQTDPVIRQAVLKTYREELLGFGPTLACEKLAERGQKLSARALHLWLVEEGLWEKPRRVDCHRRRRERRSCFGEMAQADGSEHDWLEGRGPRMTLLGMIDDATGQILVRFYESETTEAYMDLLGRYVRKHGRPATWYSDRHSIFRAESTEDRERSVPTQFSRAAEELGIELNLAAILSIQETRTVANDYTIRFENPVYQLLPPVWPGERGGRVTVEKRLDGTMHLRFKKRYLAYEVVSTGEGSLAQKPIPAAVTPSGKGGTRKDRDGLTPRSAAVHRPVGCSGSRRAGIALSFRRRVLWYRQTRLASSAKPSVAQDGVTGHFYLRRNADISICA